MEPKDAKKIALLLRVIADELYIARTDRDFKVSSGEGPDRWFGGGRNIMIRGIEKMREDVDRID